MASCNLKNESCGFRCTGYDGSKQWKKIHAAADEIECEECRVHGKALMSGAHDTVNINLGKKPYNAKNFVQFAKEVQCALNRCKSDGYCS